MCDIDGQTGGDKTSNTEKVGVSSLLTANMLPAGCSGSAVLTRLTRRCSCHGVEFKPKLYISSAQGSE